MSSLLRFFLLLWLIPALSWAQDWPTETVEEKTKAVSPTKRLQDQINTAFDKVTKPLEIGLSRKVFTTATVKVFEGPAADWQRVWDAICEANLMNWHTKPKYLGNDDGLVRDAEGFPMLDPTKKGSVAVRLKDQQQALDIIRELGLSPAAPVLLRSDDTKELLLAARSLEAAGLSFERLPLKLRPDGSVAEKGGVAVLFTDEEAAAAALQKAELKAAAGGLVGSEGFWFIVVLLVVGSTFFTLWYGFINVRLFRHAIDCVRGKYDNPDDEGEISHFKALTSALSATVGLGNIAGVAIAIVVGGPGAVFWMWVVAFVGMTMKFNSCFLAQLYRRVKPDGSVLGGPMVYLDQGIREQYPKLGWLGKVLGVMFAFMCIMGAFGAGNLFQANQTGSIVAYTIGNQDSSALLIGVGLALGALVGIVIIGGIRKIGDVTSKIVPAMCGLYCIIALAIVLRNFDQVPKMFGLIFSDAFDTRAIISGGIIGVLFNAMKRAAFSNEAGLGSAAIAHAAAKTREPVREGVVAMIGPFIDTIMVCTMTALAILITGAHLKGGNGVEVTAQAFGSLLGPDIGNVVLMIMVCVFAYSTLISWCYYGERSVEYLFGPAGILPYRVVYVLIAILGPVLSLGRVVDFADMMVLSMAFPNIIGSIILAPKIKHHVSDYVRRLRSGEMKPVS